LHTNVPRDAEALIGALDEAGLWVSRHNVWGFIGRPVVYDDQLDIIMGLIQHTLDGITNKVPVVATGDDD